MSKHDFLNLNFRAIGQVNSCYADKFGTPRQPGLVKSSRAFLQIYSEFQPELSLQGLEEFSHLWVIFLFHKNKSERFHAKVHPPRLEGETKGVFSTRSPHRPNPIGLSVVKIEEVKSDGVWVSGIDLIEGTPLIDIKPYLPSVESLANASTGWLKELPHLNIEVEWSSQAEQDLKKCEHENLRSLVEESLKLDPRPTVYKGYEGKESQYRDSHIIQFYNWDVHFYFTSPNHVIVDKIIKLD